MPDWILLITMLYFYNSVTMYSVLFVLIAIISTFISFLFSYLSFSQCNYHQVLLTHVMMLNLTIYMVFLDIYNGVE